MTEVLPEEVAWSSGLWAMLNDRGIWGVPRSGIVFQKREQERVFAVVARMPWEPAMAGTITAAQLREQQDGEVVAIRLRFEPLGIAVVDETEEEANAGTE